MQLTQFWTQHIDLKTNKLYNKYMKRIRACIECNRISFIHGHGLCNKCYFKKHNQLPETKKRKALWMKDYYKRNKEKILLYSSVYSKTDKGKDARRKFDKKHRDAIRFGNNRERTLQRDNYQCQNCGSTEKLIVHHIDKKDSRCHGGIPNHSINNLITLCMGCHRKIHGKDTIGSHLSI